MARLADFSSVVRNALAQRAGYRCSFPTCPASTIGPSAESATSTAKSGMACHIYAAEDGPAARRIGHNKSFEELRSIENGIWMCYRHGKIIDTDECSYTPQLLADWRRLAERRAGLRHELGRELGDGDLLSEALAKVTVELQVPEATHKIAEVIQVSCLGEVWGTQNALTVRDFVAEICRNALTHGGATNFQLTVSDRSLILSDDGDAFSLADLLRSDRPQGGATSLKQMQCRAPGLVASYVRQENRNVTYIGSTNAFDEMLSTSPCTTYLSGGRASIQAAMKFVEAHPECGTIFLRPTHGFLSYSDIHSLLAVISQYNFGDRDIAMIIEPHSEGLKNFIAEAIPSIRVIEIKTINHQGRKPAE